MDRSNRRRRIRWTVPALVALLLAACATDRTEPADPAGDDPGDTGVARTDEVPEPVESPAGDVFGRIPEIVREVEPSVVAVLSPVGEGSGVVWDAEGTIVTNDHVVADATELQVALADGTRVDATVLASDPLTDIAVLRAERAGLPPAEFAAELPEVGDLAIAIGNPLGFENTVTAGIVSGLQRAIPGTAPVSQSLIDLIQTDAAISPGNSGGALVDADGRVVGINVAHIPPAARAVAIGFAIPSSTVIDVVEQLLEDGSVTHAYLGVQPTALTEQIRQRLGVDAERGVVVLVAVDAGPAARAGIGSGDVITAIGDEPVHSVEQFLAALRRYSPGDRVTVQVARGGAELEVEVTLADRPTS